MTLEVRGGLGDIRFSPRTASCARRGSIFCGKKPRLHMLVRLISRWECVNRRKPGRILIATDRLLQFAKRRARFAPRQRRKR